MRISDTVYQLRIKFTPVDFNKKTAQGLLSYWAKLGKQEYLILEIPRGPKAPFALPPLLGKCCKMQTFSNNMLSKVSNANVNLYLVLKRTVP